MIAGKNCNGQSFSMNYAVADITLPLDSVSQICDTGARVVFEKAGGYIENPDGSKSTFCRNGDTYSRQVWVHRDPHRDPDARGKPFGRQGRQIS